MRWTTAYPTQVTFNYENHKDGGPYPKLVEDTLNAMIGDINLFLSEEDEREAVGLSHRDIQEDIVSKSILDQLNSI